MKLNNDKCDINECVESTAAAPPDIKHAGPHQDQATPAKSPTCKVPEDAAALIRALGLSTVDVPGFSLDGFIAQDLTRRHPDLVRKLTPGYRASWR
ncbi:alpha/beta hydrolase [Pseudomonas sp. St316]|uniref:alpha/beta fold hydrolase n=1 Tax=Pseudomonas sp. St316 TaxID=2678257 RepID=UPI001BB33BFB|nr:alpha/beta hydrolase [Pseudomonas sp. St316]